MANPQEMVSSTNPTAKHIALITCSTRPQRINPLITTSVLSVLQEHIHTLSKVPKTDFEIIDLASPLNTAELNKKLLSLAPEDYEPKIPAQMPEENPSSHYTHESTQAWSTLIRRFDAFIFVTPQYNWSFPAPLKHVLDLLYHEWSGKVGWVVSYGNRGGNLCRGHLEQVLKGVHMRTVLDGDGQGVELKVPVKIGLQCIAKGELDGAIVEGWKESGMLERLKTGVEEVVKKLQ